MSTLLSGIQPSGELHLGNYLGVIKNLVDLQGLSKRDTRLFFIADYHSLTENPLSTEEKQTQIKQLAVDLIALGFDPNKSILFIQSQVPEVTDLAWIFNCLTPMGELGRMTQYKDKVKKQKTNINAGLFTYPTLMAADILIYKANRVPVGEDQLQHLELTREIARRFNKRYGEVFPEPMPYLSHVPRLMSLKNPLEKMSKSDPDSYIGVFDEPRLVFEKIRGATTASNNLFKRIYLSKGKLVFEPSKDGVKHPEFKKMQAAIENFLILLEEFNRNKYKALFRNDEIDLDGLRYNELKNDLAKAIVNYFAPMRQKRERLMKNTGKILKIYQKGAEKARIIAKKTLKEVKEKIGLI